MGTSPAMCYANYHLFAYDFAFLSNAVQVLQSTPTVRFLQHLAELSAIRCFQVVAQYADDISFILRNSAEEVERLFYMSQLFQGIYGV